MLDLLLYFTTHEDEEVQIKAIIGLGMLHLISDRTDTSFNLPVEFYLMIVPSIIVSVFELSVLSQGFQFIMHPELMFVQDVKVLYNSTLSDESSLVSLKIQVLKNLQTYLQEEDTRMQEADRECEFAAMP